MSSSCLCSSTTLRLFVRSVVQLEIPSASSSSLRTGTSARQLRSRPKALRSFCAAPARRDASKPPAKDENQESAFAELSLEGIDKIVAELDAVRPNIPGREDGRLSSRKERQGGGGVGEGYSKIQRQQQPQENLVRRTKIHRKEAGLAIHYSAPRLPPAPKPHPPSPREPRESKAKSTSQTSSPRKDDWTPPPRQHWQIDKAALATKFPTGWSPLRRLSPDALAGIRALHEQMPTEFTTAALADRFQVSPEAIRRILKGKWTPNAQEEDDRARRWLERGKRVYEKHVAEGQKAPRKWREMGILRRRERNVGRGVPRLITTTRRAGGVSMEGEDGLAGRIL